MLPLVSIAKVQHCAVIAPFCIVSNGAQACIEANAYLYPQKLQATLNYTQEDINWKNRTCQKLSVVHMPVIIALF